MRRGAAVILAAALGVVALGGPASADRSGRGSFGSTKKQGSGNADTEKGTVSATAGVQFDTSANGKPGEGRPVGPLTPVGNWTPPACWYQPTYTPKQMKAESETVWAENSPSEEWKQQQRDRYQNGKPYKDFNLDQQGKGYFWEGYSPPENASMPGANSCDDEPFWVPIGAPPPPGHKNAVTPAVLAELAYREILIPQGKALLNPAGVQTVNVPTWVWMDATTFKPVSVRAYLPGQGVEATTTATPVSMRVDPGTADARLYPASGTCAMNADGSLGTPYSGDASAAPPCGVTYLRSTDGGGPFELTVTVTWRISWTGTGQATPKALPTGRFGTPQEVTVREIQTVNR